MKIVSVAESGPEVARLVAEAREEGEPIALVERSRPAAYVLGAEQFESMQAELRALRRTELLADVKEAGREIEDDLVRRHLPRYQDADQLMADLSRA
ncbi:MAG: type II toxin-antitoxin system Phd/YefM family antitoxin [Chloroflexi bacterium]|nr:type II toxin-antitoxin system Phd/YefM family antitoxin [Chloroflexota bacterium]